MCRSDCVETILQHNLFKVENNSSSPTRSTTFHLNLVLVQTEFRLKYSTYMLYSFSSMQVRDLSLAYLLVGGTYMYVGVLIFAAFPSPPLSKDCIEPVRHKLVCLFFYIYLFEFFFQTLYIMYRKVTFLYTVALKLNHHIINIVLFYLILPTSRYAFSYSHVSLH